ncbi:hypothetical protein D3C86_1632880 [compost metagenome]
MDHGRAHIGAQPQPGRQLAVDEQAMVVFLGHQVLADRHRPFVIEKHLRLAVGAQRRLERALDERVAVAVDAAEDRGVAGELAGLALHLQTDITELEGLAKKHLCLRKWLV